MGLFLDDDQLILLGQDPTNDHPLAQALAKKSGEEKKKSVMEKIMAGITKVIEYLAEDFSEQDVRTYSSDPNFIRISMQQRALLQKQYLKLFT